MCAHARVCAGQEKRPKREERGQNGICTGRLFMSVSLGGDFFLFLTVKNIVQISWRRQKITRNSTSLTLTSPNFLCFIGAPSWPQHKFEFSKMQHIFMSVDTTRGRREQGVMPRWGNSALG